MLLVVISYYRHMNDMPSFQPTTILYACYIVCIIYSAIEVWTCRSRYNDHNAGEKRKEQKKYPEKSKGHRRPNVLSVDNNDSGPSGGRSPYVQWACIITSYIIMKYHIVRVIHIRI